MRALAIAALLGAPLGAQGASFHSTGVGCPSPNAPFLTLAPLPVLGQSSGVTVRRLPADTTAAALLLGATPAGVPLGAGCTLLIQPVALLPMALATGAATTTIAIPNQAWLLGGSLLAQGAAVATSAGPLGVALSDRATMTIGRPADLTITANPGDPRLGTVTHRSGKVLYRAASSSQESPVVWALENSGRYGNHIRLGPGDHAGWTFDARAASWQLRRVNAITSSASDPLVIEGAPGARIVTNAPTGDTLYVLGGQTGHTFHHITWYGVTIGGSGRSAVHIGNSTDASIGNTYDSWRFVDCEIDGGYDHCNATGTNSKWGIHSYRLRDFEWVGGSIHGIRREHAMYMHNPAGDIAVRNARVYEVGRTAIQVVARLCESSLCGLPANPGEVLITGNVIADTGLEPGNFHAGSSITVAGRTSRITVRDNTIAFGMDTFTPGLRQCILALPTYPSGRPYGAGAIVVWAEDQINNTDCDIRGNAITYEASSGDRAAVSVSSCDVARVEDNTVQVGAHHIAIEIGRAANPTHRVPLAYCVRGNTLIPGTGGRAQLRVGGSGPFTQPRQLGIPCQ